MSTRNTIWDFLLCPGGAHFSCGVFCFHRTLLPEAQRALPGNSHTRGVSVWDSMCFRVQTDMSFVDAFEKGELICIRPLAVSPFSYLGMSLSGGCLLVIAGCWWRRLGAFWAGLLGSSRGSSELSEALGSCRTILAACYDSRGLLGPSGASMCSGELSWPFGSLRWFSEVPESYGFMQQSKDDRNASLF